MEIVYVQTDHSSIPVSDLGMTGKVLKIVSLECDLCLPLS